MSPTATTKAPKRTAKASTGIPVLGEPYGGGFYVAPIRHGGATFALIVSPKATGEHADTVWNKSTSAVAEALTFGDGYANTIAMAQAGSALAQWAVALRIGKFADWYLPSLDELELCYRYLKPSDAENYLYARSGINVSAAVPTYPYSATLPAQTTVTDFRRDGKEAFDTVWYWSSTQHAATAGYAWSQDFGHGNQYNGHKGLKFRARAVRRIKI